MEEPTMKKAIMVVGLLVMVGAFSASGTANAAFTFGGKLAEAIKMVKESGKGFVECSGGGGGPGGIIGNVCKSTMEAFMVKIKERAAKWKEDLKKAQGEVKVQLEERLKWARNLVENIGKGRLDKPLLDSLRKFRSIGPIRIEKAKAQ
jgi:hypothetical protein